jgi:rod shape-determining protein MreB and related proteins
LFKYIRAALSGGPFYVRLRRSRLVVRNASTGAVFDDEPLISLTSDAKPRIVAIGATARASAFTPTNPFEHPRVFIADFLLAEVVLKHAFHEVASRSWISPNPIVVCHVLEPLEGGLSSIEHRALLELMHGAGARAVFFWSGRELTDEDLRSGTYRVTGAG